MKDISAVEDMDTLKYVIRHELKNYGIKVPKEKRSSVRCTQAQQGKEKSGCRSSTFGCALDEVPTIFTQPASACPVPKVLVDSVQFLTDNIECEGLFRKPGSRSRQKELQRILENGSPVPADSHVHDVAGLFKFFFRDLPDPLISSKLCDALIKCQQLGSSQELRYATRLLCLTMPALQLYTLRYAVKFLKQVAASVSTNRMDATNLALVMTPNLMGGFKSDKAGKTAATEKLLRQQMAVVKHLIENADEIGVVPETVLERVENYGNRSADLLTDRLTSEDELDKSGDAALDERKKSRRRRRSGPIQGLMSGIGQSLGILKSGAGSSAIKTPGSDEIIENPSFLGETPRILRSSKRKASEDLTTSSSAKRKAMLHQMTVDPQYSKPGLHLHKDGRHRVTGPDSPMTPIRPTRPALGEIDAVTEDGATVFKFQTPSIKFADESFTAFSATPSGKADVTGATPAKKYGKLNPLSSRKYKRRSGPIQADISTPRSVFVGNTPKTGSVYESIKKRLGHKHTRTQPTPIHLNDMPDKSVGWRLANPPEGSTGPGTLPLGCSPQLKRTPLIKRKQRRHKTPSSPATLFPPRNPLTSPDGQRKEQRSVVCGKVQGSQIDFGAESESPKVVVVDLKSKKTGASQDDVFNTQESRHMETDVYAAKGEDIRGDVYDTNEGVRFVSAETERMEDPMVDPTEACIQQVPVLPAVQHQTLQQSISQKSLSSVLSQVSVDSTKSVFSVEVAYEDASERDEMDETMRNDDKLMSVIQADNACESMVCVADMNASGKIDHATVTAEVCEMMEEEEEEEEVGEDEVDVVWSAKEHDTPINTQLLDTRLTPDMPDGDDGYTGSLESLECMEPCDKTETEPGPRQRLVKSISMDSGRGLSLDNLASFDDARLASIDKRILSERGIRRAQDIPPGLVKMLSDRLSPVEDASEESACSVSSEENPQFKETKAFWKLAKTGHIFNKSLSDTQVNSPGTRGQHGGQPALSYHSQMHRGRKEQQQGARRRCATNTSINASSVRSNIDMFNSMCQQTSAGNPRSKMAQSSCHGSAQQIDGVSSSSSHQVLSGASKHGFGLESPKPHLTKSVSIDSGMNKLGREVVHFEPNPFSRSSHDDSYELALFKGTAIENAKTSQESVDPRPLDSENVVSYENPEEMSVHDGNQGLEQIPAHLAPIHALHNKSLTPLKLASSTIIRTPGKKSIKIRHRSPLKQLQVATVDTTPTPKEVKGHKRYPCSPRNPLQRQHPLSGRERPLVPNHVRDDMDVVEL